MQTSACWAHLLPGAALVTAGVVATACLLAFYVKCWREHPEERHSGAQIAGMALGVALMHFVPLSGVAVACAAPCTRNAPADRAETACLWAMAVVLPAWVQAALAGGTLLLVTGAGIPGCAGGAAVPPALAGAACGTIVIQLSAALLISLVLGANCLREVALPAAAKAAATAAGRLSKSVREDGSESVGSVGEAAAEVEAV